MHMAGRNNSDSSVACVCEFPGFCELQNSHVGFHQIKVCRGERSSGILIQAEPNPETLVEENGPGTELKKLLASRGLVTSADCGCNRKIRQMNKWGPDLCERKLDQIVNWLLTSAKSRKPWTRIVPELIQRAYCKNLVKTAIERSKS